MDARLGGREARHPPRTLSPLPPTLRLFLRRYVTWCARRGRFAQMQGATAISWGSSTRYFWLSDQERRDAIAAIVDPEKYRGSFVWGLEKSRRWPEVRTRVIGFSQRSPLKNKRA